MQNSDKTPNLLKWRLTLAETLAFGVTIAVLTLWLQTTFQSKSEATEWKQGVEARMSSLETRVGQIQADTNKIAVDVSYIRGRLEPQDK